MDIDFANYQTHTEMIKFQESLKLMSPKELRELKDSIFIARRPFTEGSLQEKISFTMLRSVQEQLRINERTQ